MGSLEGSFLGRPFSATHSGSVSIKKEEEIKTS